MISRHWILFTLLSLLCYGFWGYFGNLTAKYTNAYSALFFSSIGTFAAGLICLSLLHFQPAFSAKGTMYGMLTGLATGVGTLFFIAALRSGSTAPTVFITALYPVVTLLLCVFLLNEHLTLKHVIGMVLALMAIYCFN